MRNRHTKTQTVIEAETVQHTNTHTYKQTYKDAEENK